jgi:hypothetical protein
MKHDMSIISVEHEDGWSAFDSPSPSVERQLLSSNLYTLLGWQANKKEQPPPSQWCSLVALATPLLCASIGS